MLCCGFMFGAGRHDAERAESWGRTSPTSTSGNAAFDAYRAETLRRLEQDHHDFRDFLGRLRVAKDRAEFDQFMTERRERPAASSPHPEERQI